MITATKEYVCPSCHGNIKPGELITQDEAGDWVHADGCGVPDFWEQELGRAPDTKLPGYKGAKLSACPKCHITHSVFVECD